MNTNLITTACALACAAAASGAQAQSSVLITGIMDAAARSVSNEDKGSIKSLVSGSNSTSRLVVRGTEDLAAGLAASFWLEHGLAVDTGAATGGFWDRRATVSLVSKAAGELRLGRDFVPSYVGWSRFDPFSYVGVAGSNNGVSATPLGPIRSAFGSNANTTVRASNAIQYFLPAGLGGVEGQLLVAAAEGSTAADNKTIGGRIGWSGGPVSLSAAQTVTENGATLTGKFKDTAIGGSFTMNPVRVNLAWRQFKQASSQQTDLILSGVVTLGAHEVKASLLKVNLAGRVGSTAIDANDARQLGLGWVYNLSKRSALYATYSRINNDGVATFQVPGGPTGLVGGKDSSGNEAGIRYSF